MLAAVFGRAVSVLVVPFSVPSLGLDVVVVVPLDSAPSCLSHSLTLLCVLSPPLVSFSSSLCCALLSCVVGLMSLI